MDELRPRDMIPSAERGLLMVAGLEWTSHIETVYNFGVDEYHTYFVGEVGAWVHNCLTKLSPYQIEVLKKAGLDPHMIKKDALSGNAKISHYDLYLDAEKNIVVNWKRSPKVPGEPTGFKWSDFE